MSREVLSWRRLPTAFGISPRLQRRENGRPAPYFTSIWLGGAETVAPKAIRAPLKEGHVNSGNA